MTTALCNFELPKQEIHLWHCRFDANTDSMDAFKGILSEDEKKKAAKFKFDIHREQSIISRGILRMLLGKYLKKHPHDLEFGYTEYDKPFLKSPSSLQFNVSHSGNQAAFAFVQDVEIGVDIEKIKSDFDVMDIAQHFFSSYEIQSLQALPEKDRVAGFYRCWTRKESFIKAKGSGLSFPLTSFTVSLNVEYAEILITEWDLRENDEWKLFSFRPFKGYIGALSVRSDVKTVKYWDLDQFNALSLAF
jgi:4'-phosphopantetheinyl transferase